MQSSSPNSRYSCSKRGLNLKRELVQFEHGEHCSLSASLSLVVSSRDSILKTLLSQPAQRVSPFGLNVRSKAKKEAFLRHEPDLRIQSIPRRVFARSAFRISLRSAVCLALLA
jgi:hypothetical protein